MLFMFHSGVGCGHIFKTSLTSILSIAVPQWTKLASYQHLPAGLPNTFDFQLLTQETCVHNHSAVLKALQVYIGIQTFLERWLTYFVLNSVCQYPLGLWLKDDEKISQINCQGAKLFFLLLCHLHSVKTLEIWTFKQHLSLINRNGESSVICASLKISVRSLSLKAVRMPVPQMSQNQPRTVVTWKSVPFMTVILIFFPPNCLTSIQAARQCAHITAIHLKQQHDNKYKAPIKWDV